MLSDYKWYMAPTERRINIILLGMDQLAHELDKEIEVRQAVCYNDISITNTLSGRTCYWYRYCKI